MFNKKSLIILLVMFAVVVIGDDETRHSLKRVIQRRSKREHKEGWGTRQTWKI